jgi:hypothetical protein
MKQSKGEYIARHHIRTDWHYIKMEDETAWIFQGSDREARNIVNWQYNSVGQFCYPVMTDRLFLKSIDKTLAFSEGHFIDEMFLDGENFTRLSREQTLPLFRGLSREDARLIDATFKMDFYDLVDHNYEFIKDITTEQTGGNIMNDVVILKDGHIIRISEDIVCIFRNKEADENNEPLSTTELIIE